MWLNQECVIFFNLKKFQSVSNGNVLDRFQHRKAVLPGLFRLHNASAKKGNNADVKFIGFNQKKLGGLPFDNPPKL